MFREINKEEKIVWGEEKGEKICDSGEKFGKKKEKIKMWKGRKKKGLGKKE